jgi:hypothetical protein
MRANPDDRIVINEVSIGGCLITAWNVVAEFLRLRGNSQLIVVVRRASCSWVGCSRSSSHITLLIVEPGAQDHRCAPLWMTTVRTGTAYPSETSRRRSTMPWVHKDESQRFPPSWRVSINVWSSDIWSRIEKNASRRDQSYVNTWHMVFRLVRTIAWSSSHTSSIDVLCYWDWLLFFFGIFLGCLRYVPWDFSECPRCGSILSTYS